MSWQDSKWAIAQQAGSAGAKAVLLVSAEASKGGRCILSHATIAQRAEMDRRSVIRHLQALEDRGLISRRRRSDRNGHRTSDEIILTRSQGDDLSSDQGDSLSVRRLGQGDKTDVAKVTDEAPLSDSLSQEPVSNRDSEPGFSLVAPSEPAKPKRASKRTALPDGFPDQRATEEMRLRFVSEGIQVDAAVEAERFRNHHLSKGSLMADWPAALRTWTINGIAFAKERASRNPQQSQSGRTGLAWLMDGAE